LVWLEPCYECTRLVALPSFGGYGNWAQCALLGEGLLTTNRDAVPGLHTTAQGAECFFALRKFRNRGRAFRIRGAVQRRGENRVRVDVEVVLLHAIDEVVLLDVCE